VLLYFLVFAMSLIRIRKVSFRLILVVPFLLQIVGAVGLTGWISLQNSQKAISNLVTQLQIETSQRLETQLNQYFDCPGEINRNNLAAIDLGLLNPNNLQQTGKFFWRQMEIFNVGYINFANPAGAFIGVERLDHKTYLLNEIQSQVSGQLSIYPIDRRGNRGKRIGVKPVPPVQKEGWYADAVQAGHPVWSEIYAWDDKPGVMSISSSYPVYDHQRNLVGVIGVDLLLSEIGKFLQNLRISPSSHIFIMENNGLLVANSGPAKSFKLVKGQAQRLEASQSSDPRIQQTTQQVAKRFGANPFHQLANVVPEERLFTFEENGIQQFVYVTPWKSQPGLNWLIVLVVPESDFMAVIDENTRVTMLVCLAALAVATLVGLMISRKLMRPILRAIAAANAISRGHWQHHLPEAHTEEMTSLAHALNRMGEQLQTYFNHLEYNAYHDSLTGLLNQTAFRLKLQAAINRSQQAIALESGIPDTLPLGNLSNYLFAILFLDLDYFKLINDSLGHLAGDELLVQVANRLEDCVAFAHPDSHQVFNIGSSCASDTTSNTALSRFGGDEFIILFDGISDATDAIRLAEQISRSLQQPFMLTKDEVFISASIGIVLSQPGCAGHDQPESLLRNADIALYRAKANGKAGYEFFDHQMHAEVVDRLQLETDLRRAFERQEFEVHYQPIVDVKTREIQGFEALVRWNHPTKGMISPGRFIPVSEETGLVVKLGWWVLRQACQQMHTWQQRFPSCCGMVMSVNMSSKQFMQPDCLEQIDQILWQTHLLHRNLKLEITESLLMNHGEATRAKLKRLQQSGIKISIDDFGTGYSSLSYLDRFPINTLKIDRSFISRLGAVGDNSEIVEAIMVLAHKLGMEVIAEGVETVEQLDQLAKMDCEQAQGFLFSPPVAPGRVVELLTDPPSQIKCRALNNFPRQKNDDSHPCRI
jgi:predicted signal transduction protein with EAL and GGDEF domain